MFGGDFRLDAPPRSAVLGDHDGALDGDAALLELVVIGWYPVIDEDERTGHVTVDGVGVVTGELFRLLIRRGVSSDRGFLQARIAQARFYAQAILPEANSVASAITTGAAAATLDATDEAL